MIDMIDKVYIPVMPCRDQVMCVTETTVKLSGEPEKLRAVLRDKFGMTDADIDRELEKELQKRDPELEKCFLCGEPVGVGDRIAKTEKGMAHVECLEDPRNNEEPVETPSLDLPAERYTEFPKDELDPNAQQSTLLKDGRWVNSPTWREKLVAGAKIITNPEKPEPVRCRVCCKPIIETEPGTWMHTKDDYKTLHRAVPVDIPTEKLINPKDNPKEKDCVCEKCTGLLGSAGEEPPKSKFNKGDFAYYLGKDGRYQNAYLHIYYKKWNEKKGMWTYDTSLPGLIPEDMLQKEPMEMGDSVANCEQHGKDTHLG